jgi:hypothetical protein
MVVGFTTTYAIGAYHHWCCEFDWLINKPKRDDIFKNLIDFIDWFLVLNATFCNISAISWQGATCVEDVNECTDNLTICNTIPNSQCSNMNGSYKCNCVTGYEKLTNGSCQGRINKPKRDDIFKNLIDFIDWFLVLNATFCNISAISWRSVLLVEETGGHRENYWGTSCAQTCLCDMAKTSDCNNVDGNCTCKTGWQGATCVEDVNECTDNPTICNAVTFERSVVFSGSSGFFHQ